MPAVMEPPQETPLPSSSSPSLILTHPTPSERRRTWTLTHRLWGTALSVDEYLRREEYLLTAPLARNGGATQWILTIEGMPPDQRPILSSCETLRKPAFVTDPRTPDGVLDAFTHGVGSVFTDAQYRGRGYASKIMCLVGEALKRHQGAPMKAAASATNGDSPSSPVSDSFLKPVAFSVLYSDIGKKFYASHGWAAHPSVHMRFPPSPPSEHAPYTNGHTPGPASEMTATPIGYHELAELCARDESLLREKMARMASQDPSTTFVALAPDLDALLWHLMREDFITNTILKRGPTVRGAVYGPKGRRVWAAWTRTYQKPPPATDENTLHILRFVLEDEAFEDEAYLAEGVHAVLDLARREASEWYTSHVQLWNPSPLLQRLIERAGLPHEAIEREKDSIPSLMWYGDGRAEDVVWVANEKYAWY